MKQHISVDQLNQLTESGRRKLRSWWVPQRGDLYIKETVVINNENPILVADYHDQQCCGGDNCMYDREDHGLEIEKKHLPLLSLGQLIQFLEDKETTIEILTGWRQNEDLCDRLWSAVLTILNAE